MLVTWAQTGQCSDDKKPWEREYAIPAMGTVAFLKKACEDKSDSVWAGYCRGIIKGLTVLMSANAEISQENPLSACIGNTSVGELANGFSSWVDQNPKEASNDDAIGFAIFLSETHPCK